MITNSVMSEKLKMKKVPEEFLKEEVRNGFFISSAIKQAWAAELEVLIEIDRVCQEHGIKYYADWGTLLGTVRHGGYIPWDDDLDIVMKREDYQKFLSVANELEDGFWVQTYENQADYWLFMAKVVGKNNICFEPEHLRRFHNFPFIACVDIFVLDYVYADDSKEEERKKNCLYALAVADSIINGELSKNEIINDVNMIAKMLGNTIKYTQADLDDSVKMGRIIYKVIENEFAKSVNEPSVGLVQLFPWGLKGTARIYPIEYYSEPVRLPFEFTTMPVPIAYDRMLSDRYGDYLKVNKSAGAHDYPFFEGQRAELEKTMGFSMPQFDFECAYKYKDLSKRNEARSGSLKVIVTECIEEIVRIGNEIGTNIYTSIDGNFADKGMYDEKEIEKTLTDLVTEIQGLQTFIIDLGNLIESVKGENHPIIQDLEMLCECLYNIYTEVNKETVDIKSMTEIVNVFSKALEETVLSVKNKLLLRKSVLILPTFLENWDSMSRAFKTALLNNEFDVYVMPLPYYFKDFDGQPLKICCDVEKFPAELMPIDYKTITEEKLQLLWPDYIFIDNPYDEWNPAFSTMPQFYSSNIWKYTENLVLMCPHQIDEHSDKEERSIKNMRYYGKTPGFIYADRILFDSESHIKMSEELIHDLICTDILKEIDVFKEHGFIENTNYELQKIFLNDRNLAKNTDNDGSNKEAFDVSSMKKKSLLYCLSLGRYYEYEEAFFEKLGNVLKILYENERRINITVCTYPTICDEKTKKEFNDRIFDMVETYALDNDTILFTNSSFTPLEIEEFDAYYGDASPYVLLFTERNKPVMVQNYDIIN